MPWYRYVLPRTRACRMLCLACLAGLVSAAPAGAADQPQWGERFTRNMVSRETGLPDGFDPKTGRNVKWTAPLGTETYASPIVARGKVLIGTNNRHPRDPQHPGDRTVLLCLNEKDGSLAWQLLTPKLTGDPFLDWPGVGICSPPTVEGDRVYLLTNRGEVVCLDLNGMANGNDGPFRDEGRRMAPEGSPPEPVNPTDADILWIFDVRTEIGIHNHDSAHASILIDGPLLYVNTCNGVDNTHRRIRKPDAASLIVLDKATGRLVAQDGERLGPKIAHAAWSSPALGEVGGRRLLFYGGPDGVCYAFDAWRPGGAAGKVGTLKKVWWVDCDPDAPKVDIHHYQGNRREGPSVINSLPVLAGGRLYVTAGGDFQQGKRQSWLKCIDPRGEGDRTASGVLWSCPLKGSTCATPAVWNGLVFVTDCGRQIHCVDAATGQEYWTQDTRGEIWASALVADGKVYVGSRAGDFWVMAASKEKKVLSTIELGSPVSSTATAANGVLYVPTADKLYAVKVGG